MEIYRKFFGKKLREAIANAGLNQSRLAEKLDVETSSVSRWVNGYFPEEKRFSQICKVLNVTPDFFLTFPEIPAPQTTVLIDALAYWEKENQALRSPLGEDLAELWVHADEETRKSFLGLLKQMLERQPKKSKSRDGA